jgi:hypothetical protein
MDFTRPWVCSSGQNIYIPVKNGFIALFGTILRSHITVAY